MTKEDKELLLKDLCARLPYGITIYRKEDSTIHRFHYSDITENIDQFSHFLEYSGIDDIKPYLRPMDSMTEEEKKEYYATGNVIWDYDTYSEPIIDVFEMTYKTFDWLNKNMFDYRGLIPMGLALPAKEGMYKNQSL